MLTCSSLRYEYKTGRDGWAPLCEKHFTENPQSNLPEYVLWFAVSALAVSGHLPAMMQQDEQTVAMANTLAGVGLFCVKDL